MKTENLKIVRDNDNIGVRDVEDGLSIWWPKADAQAEIQAANDPEAAALKMCETDPMRGDWHN